jgi:endogenous inhibitor of DNA gyrase (YacG/DUF329 family)
MTPNIGTQPEGRVTPDIATALTAINAVIGDLECQQCGQPVSASPSQDFCSEDCQQTWRETRAGIAPGGDAGTLDQPYGESGAVPPLGWLGPPPGAVVRAGHELLDDVAEFVARFSVFPSEHCAPTLTLWYAHTHAIQQFYVTPRLILDSAEPASGKTRVLEVAQHLVAVPEMTISATTAALFRLVSMGPITILFDEVDAIFNPKNGGNNEDLRGLLNAGYKRSATIARCVGDAKDMKVQRFPVYAPAALVGISGGMPATITTRAITIHMRRRRTDEPVEPFRERHVAREAQPLREQLAAWINSTGTRLGDAQPDMPEGVTDRSAEIWEPLLAIADTAGGHWPDTARDACRHFVLNTGPQITSPGVRMLADLRDLFARRRTDRLPTKTILAELLDLDEAPWGDLHGKPLDARRLSRELGRYGARPVTFEDDEGSTKGYVTYCTTGRQAQTGLADAWSRYLPAAIGNPGKTGKTAGEQLTDADQLTDPSVIADRPPAHQLTDPSVSTSRSVSP